MDREEFVRQAIEHDQELATLRKAEIENNARLRAAKIAHQAAMEQTQAARTAEGQALRSVNDCLSSAQNLLFKQRDSEQKARRRAGELFDAAAAEQAAEELAADHAEKVTLFGRMVTMFGS